jgi:acyl-CoA reductase-like NAD-dependent aldehyde dehydrogenase
MIELPETIPNWIDNADSLAADQATFDKLSPSSGRKLFSVARSGAAEVDAAVAAAVQAQPVWAALTPVRRGDLIRAVAKLLEEHRDDIAEIVATETGKSRKDARGETDGAVEMGYFVAGEGRRFYGKTTTSALPNREAMVVRQPLGVAGLIIAANTPAANVAWKVFPALLCGNAAVLKAAEDTPATAHAFAVLAERAGIPPGVFNVVQGFGEEAGGPLARHPSVDIVSFTGSTSVGRQIQRDAADRLAKVCLELGGKNPFVVCDDADLDRAVDAAVLSAFSNAGQRCAAGSRIIVFDAVYAEFVSRLLARVATLRVGPDDDDDFGPVINESQLDSMLGAIERAKADGSRILAGGARLERDGFYLGPTVIENADRASEISCSELFGPIATLYRVSGFEEAIEVANDSPYGLTAAIHTTDLDRAHTFIARIRSGVASINGATYGSEPHMPFGGERQSGNGFREAGVEALDVYSDLKTVYINVDPSRV